MSFTPSIASFVGLTGGPGRKGQPRPEAGQSMLVLLNVGVEVEVELAAVIGTTIPRPVMLAVGEVNFEVGHSVKMAVGKAIMVESSGVQVMLENLEGISTLHGGFAARGVNLANSSRTWPTCMAGPPWVSGSISI